MSDNIFYMSKKIIITPKERLILQKKLIYLEMCSEKNIEDLQASLDSDLTENFALTKLHEKQVQTKQEIDNLRNILEEAEISQKNNQDFVELGSIVSYALLPDKQEKITVELTSKFTSPPQVISLDSPAGKALLGKKVGDILKISQSGKSEQLIQILEIK